MVRQTDFTSDQGLTQLTRFNEAPAQLYLLKEVATWFIFKPEAKNC